MGRRFKGSCIERYITKWLWKSVHSVSYIKQDNCVAAVSLGTFRDDSFDSRPSSVLIHSRAIVHVWGTGNDRLSECSFFSSRSDVMWSRAVVPLSVTACFTFQLCLNPRKLMELFSVYRWLLALLCRNICGPTRWLFGINLFICTLHLTVHLPAFCQVSVGTQ